MDKEKIEKIINDYSPELAAEEIMRLFSFNSDNNEENKKVLMAILYEHTYEKEMKIREVDYEEVVKDIMNKL